MPRVTPPDIRSGIRQIVELGAVRACLFVVFGAREGCFVQRADAFELRCSLTLVLARLLIAVLVVIDGLSYAIDTFGTVLSPGPWTDTATFTFIGEFLLGLWLVIRGPRLTVNRTLVA